MLTLYYRTLKVTTQDHVLVRITKYGRKISTGIKRRKEREELNGRIRRRRQRR
jgi:hypothetical protein